MLSIFTVMFIGVFLCLYFLNESFKDENVAVQRQITYKQLGIDLAAASDLLTNEARAYVQLGDKVHYDNYWKEINETKKRDQVVTMLKELGVPQDELLLIEEAKQNSDALVATEDAAMKAVQEQNFDLARQLMFDHSYEVNKEKITDPINHFQLAMNKRVEGEAANAHRYASRMLSLTISFLIATFMILLFMFL